MTKNVHCVGIAEPIMCDLAIRLHRKGYRVTGSTDTTCSANQQKLSALGLWPQQLGWLPDQITKRIDMALLGSKIQSHNPELQRMHQLGIPCCGSADYLSRHVLDKQRMVVVASPISKLICTMAIQILRYWDRPVDYVVDTADLQSVVQLTCAPICLIEESSWPAPTVYAHPKSRSIAYAHHILLIPPYNMEHGEMALPDYDAKLRDLIHTSPKGSTVIYADDNPIEEVVDEKEDLNGVAYPVHPHHYVGDQLYMTMPQGDTSIGPIDELRLHALSGVRELLYHVGIPYAQFYQRLAPCVTS